MSARRSAFVRPSQRKGEENRASLPLPLSLSLCLFLSLLWLTRETIRVGEHDASHLDPFIHRASAGPGRDR